jgi:uncharacterized RmlC-like cupin family protein
MIIRFAALGLSAALIAAPAFAQDVNTQRRMTPADIAAVTPQPSTTPGVATRILMGDPTKAGPYAQALTYPPGLAVKPHMHRDHRNAVIVKGSIDFGYGTVADRAQTKHMEAGSYYTEAAETPHFGFVGPEGLTLYLTGWGPTDNRPITPAK